MTTKGWRRLLRNAPSRQVFVIGLDCAAPELVFERWRDELPNLSHLASHGIWGELNSCIPAITVPAWSCMLSGRDPGELGVYGFRNRSSHSYYDRAIASSQSVGEKRIWDYLTDAGKSSVVVGVPQTYPVQPMHGNLVSGFLTPSVYDDFTHPAPLKDEVLQIAPDYSHDVAGFRTNDKDKLLREIFEMTKARLKVVDRFLTDKSWDFFMLMEIGVDRMHHGFWSYHDPEHRRYVAGNPFENAILDYYRMIDHQIGEWLDKLDKDAVVMVVSDHGAKRMDGGICLNEWLWREGYLVFNNEVPTDETTPLDKMDIDWARTTAWGDGGYVGRIYFNVQGREDNGIIAPEKYEDLRDELAEKLTAIPDPQGRPLLTKVFKPQEIYRSVRRVAPDLMVYFGDLLWRSVGSLGHGGIHTLENDTGPDDCNHAQNGMFILYDPLQEGHPEAFAGADLMDILPTLLSLQGLAAPSDLQGTSLSNGRG